MNLAELKLGILQIGATGAVAALAGRQDPAATEAQIKRIMDGKISEEEKLENLEVWATINVIAGGVTQALVTKDTKFANFHLLDQLPEGNAKSLLEFIKGGIETAKDIADTL